MRRLIRYGLLVLSLLTVVGAGPAAAFVEIVALTVSPDPPSVIEPLTATVSFTNVGSRISYGEATLEGDVISLPILEEACIVACTNGFLEHDFLVDPLPAGTYTVEIVDRRDNVFFTQTVDVVGPIDLGLRPSIELDPAAPTDNDRLRLLVAFDLDPTIYDKRLRVDSVALTGHDLHVHLSNGQPPEVDAPPVLSAPLVDVGPLEPGHYRVFVYLVPAVLVTPPPYDLVAISSFDVADADDVVLLHDRFAVRARWTDFGLATGPAHPAPDPTNESTLFTFFGRGNWELLVKVLDGCTINGHFWVLTAGATNVEYTIEIEDTVTGKLWTYTNPLGDNSPAVTDIEAFVGCPG